MLLCWGLTEESFHVKIKRDDAVDGCRLFSLFFGEKGNKNQPTKENKPMSTITILEFDIMESIKDLV